MGVALVSGFGLGFLVAAEVGPIWLLCVRTSARFGFRPGAAVGAGAATVDTLYAALGIAGATALLRIDALRISLGLAGAIVLALIAARTLWSAFRIRNGGEVVEEVATPTRAYLTAVVATASNPLTIASWAAIFSAASVAGLAAAPLLIGVAAGSATWFALLAGISAAAGRRASPRALRAVDIVAGVGLAGFAGVLGIRALRS
ncbi:MAG TPA: LysE family transporter [Gaiellaceae bacterium]|nr:LysE family transporter [Gaiellaceae bacterium]